MASLWMLRILSRCLGAFTSITGRKDGTVNRKLADMLEWTISVNPKPGDGVVATSDVVVDSATGVWVRLFVPTQDMEVNSVDARHNKPDSKMPVIFYCHGGGFVYMRPNIFFYDRFCRSLAQKCHAVVISVYYRLAPEHKFPTAYDDCYAALEWLNSEESKAVLPPNIDLSRVYLGGDSAGGNIVHHLAVQAAGKDLSPLTLRGLILLQPFFGGEERTPAELQLKNPLIVSVELLDWFWKVYLPSGSNRDHPASNIFGPHSKDISNVSIPPVLLIVGGLDPLQDWEMRYAEGMKKAGKNVQVCFYEDGVHLLGHFNQIEIGHQMMVDIVSFLESHVN